MLWPGLVKGATSGVVVAASRAPLSLGAEQQQVDLFLCAYQNVIKQRSANVLSLSLPLAFLPLRYLLETRAFSSAPSE